MANSKIPASTCLSIAPCKHANFRQLQARLDSFVGWPGRFVPKTPEELSAAGFFYIGSADRVTCFQCGITLRDWEEEHDPVQEHRRYSEHCKFIKNTDLDQLGVNTRTFCQQNKQEENKNSVKDGCSLRKNELPYLNFKSLPSGQDYSYSSKTPSESMATDSQESISNCGTRKLTDSSRLSEENRRLREKGQCKVCKKRASAMLFLPCGHLVTCIDCATEVADCVLCGKTILATVRTYVS